jgi:hypothetical protein
LRAERNASLVEMLTEVRANKYRERRATEGSMS